ncbi:MAG TPA: DNA repair protein RadC [Syntrophomonadaceae bacterium]|jgi:DNA repair protein RadC|nr:DNA repair protein RadC [Syntrophomonadaceae bacterium]HRX20673.1 DNA repair protein RadC [Syntrophomonadaceae bacterium]
MNGYSLAIKDMPESMRPRERMLAEGEHSLSDTELLAIIIGNGTSNLSALDLARHILAQHGSLRHIKEASLEELMQHPGIGPAKAVNIKAAMEIGRRISLDVRNKMSIKSPEDVKNMVMEDMRYLDREYFRVMYLDRKGGLLSMEDVSIGGLHSALVHPREVFKPAIKKSAASIILVHNHPSGDPSPSREDLELTASLIEAGKHLGIEILDHIVIGESTYCSMRSQQLIQF